MWFECAFTFWKQSDYVSHGISAKLFTHSHDMKYIASIQRNQCDIALVYYLPFCNLEAARQSTKNTGIQVAVTVML